MEADATREGWPNVQAYVQTGQIDGQRLSHSAYKQMVQANEHQVARLQRELDTPGMAGVIRERVETRLEFHQQILDICHGLTNPPLLASGVEADSPLLAGSVFCRACGLPIDKHLGYEQAGLCSACWTAWTTPYEDEVARARRIELDILRRSAEPVAIDRIFPDGGTA